MSKHPKGNKYRWKCDKCGASFSDRDEFIEHIDNHIEGMTEEQG